MSWQYTHTRKRGTSYSLQKIKNKKYLSNGQVSGSLTFKMKDNCLSAIRFRGGVILQVSCYTLLKRMTTSMSTVLLSAPHGTPFCLSEGWSRYG